MICAIALALSPPFTVWLYFFLKFRSFYRSRNEEFLMQQAEIIEKHTRLIKDQLEWEEKRSNEEAELTVLRNSIQAPRSSR
jgi:hypothetical protein